MAERATVTQAVQIGVESTPGTAVPANKLLQSISMVPEIHVNSQQYQPVGQKVNSIIVPGEEWSELAVSGVVDYTEIIYPLNMILQAATPVQQAATTAYLSTFTPAARTADTVKTMSIEQGDAVRAQKMAYAFLSELVLTFNRQGATLTGKGMGQLISDGISMTASPTAMPQKPVIPNQIDVFIDPTSGALGTTKMLRVLEAKLSIQNRYGPIWALNSSNTSWAANVELDPTFSLDLKVEADAQGMALLTALRGGTTQFVRIKCTSPDLAGTAIPFSLTLDMAVKPATPSTYADDNGIYAITFTNPLVQDAGWGKFLTVAAMNQQTAL